MNQSISEQKDVNFEEDQHDDWDSLDHWDYDEDRQVEEPINNLLYEGF